MKPLSFYNEDNLDEYERYLLKALLQQAAEDAKKPLSPTARKQIIDSFFADLTRDKKARTVAKSKATRARNARTEKSQNGENFKWKPPAPLRRS